MDVNAWQEIKKFTGIVRLSNPHIVWIWGGYGITNALSPFITLYYSAEILNQLIVKEYTAALQTALLMCTGVLDVYKRQIHGRAFSEITEAYR